MSEEVATQAPFSVVILSSFTLLFVRHIKIFVDKLVMMTFYSLEWKFGDRARTTFNSIERGLLEA